MHVICIKMSIEEHVLTFESKINWRLHVIPVCTCSLTRARLLFNLKQKKASSHWELKHENASQMKPHFTLCVIKQFVQISLICCLTLCPSLLWCSRQAWRWSACCCWAIHWKTAQLVLICVSSCSLTVVFHSLVQWKHSRALTPRSLARPGWGGCYANAQATKHESAHCFIWKVTDMKENNELNWHVAKFTIYPTIHPSVHPSNSPHIHLSIYLSGCLSNHQALIQPSEM